LSVTLVPPRFKIEFNPEDAHDLGEQAEVIGIEIGRASQFAGQIDCRATHALPVQPMHGAYHLAGFPHLPGGQNVDVLAFPQQAKKRLVLLPLHIEVLTWIESAASLKMQFCGHWAHTSRLKKRA